MSTPRHTGADATLKNTIRPKASAAAASFALAGDAIDTRVGGFDSMLLGLFIGALTGTPDSFTVDAKVQEALTGSGDWTDVVADGINTKVAFTQRTAINTQDFIQLDVSRLKPKIRVVATVAFVAGTSPTVGVSCVAQVGGGVSEPPAHA